MNSITNKLKSQSRMSQMPSKPIDQLIKFPSTQQGKKISISIELKVWLPFNPSLKQVRIYKKRMMANLWIKSKGIKWLPRIVGIERNFILKSCKKRKGT